MSKFDTYLGNIAEELSMLWNCPFSDALPVVENNSFYVSQGWAGSATPAVVAKKISDNT